jgi:hypothetical protein
MAGHFELRSIKQRNSTVEDTMCTLRLGGAEKERHLDLLMGFRYTSSQQGNYIHHCVLAGW